MNKQSSVPRDQPSDVLLPAAKAWNGRTALIVLAALVACAYYVGLAAPFIFDDLNQISFNHEVRLAHQPLKLLWEMRDESRPVVYVSLAVNYLCGGYRPWGYRVVNVGIHVAAAWLLYDLVRRTLRLPGIPARLKEQAGGIALATAALWAVHPLQTGSVTYVIQRCESLMGMFFLAALYGLLRTATESAVATQRRWWLFAAAAAVLGAASKEVMAMLPIVALLYDRVYLADSWRSVFRQRAWLHLPFVAAAALCVGLVVHALRSRAVVSAGFGMSSISSWEYLRSQPGVLLRYLRLTFWPDVLVLDYASPIEDDPWRIYGWGLLIVAVFLTGVVLLWRTPRIGFLIITWFVILAPTSSIMPIGDLCFEHRLYLPLACVAALVVVGVATFTDRFVSDADTRQLLLRTIVVLAAAALVARTYLRNRDYLSPLKIWTVSANFNPDNSRAQNAVGALLAAIPGREAEAEGRYRLAMAANPTMAMYPDNLGNLYARRNLLPQAIPWYRRAVQAEPEYLPAQLHLCRALLLNHESAAAWQAIEAAPKKLHSQYDFRKQMMFVLALAEDESVRDPQRAVTIGENLLKANQGKFPEPELRQNLAIAYAAAGRFDDASALENEALQAAQRLKLDQAFINARLAAFEQRQPWTIAAENEMLAAQQPRRSVRLIPDSETGGNDE